MAEKQQMSPKKTSLELQEPQKSRPSEKHWGFGRRTGFSKTHILYMDFVWFCTGKIQAVYGFKYGFCADETHRVFPVFLEIEEKPGS